MLGEASSDVLRGVPVFLHALDHGEVQRLVVLSPEKTSLIQIKSGPFLLIPVNDACLIEIPKALPWSMLASIIVGAVVQLLRSGIAKRIELESEEPYKNLSFCSVKP